jgi:hypothetical protein
MYKGFVEYQKTEDRGVVLNAARGRLKASVKVQIFFDFGMSAVGIACAGRTENDITSFFSEPDRERTRGPVSTVPTKRSSIPPSCL